MKNAVSLQTLRGDLEVDGTVARDVWIWTAVIVTGAADCVTTAIGLSMGFAESNPIVRPLLAVAGMPSLVVLKALIIIAVFLAVRRLPRPASSVTGHALSLVWTFAVGINIAAIVSGAPA